MIDHIYSRDLAKARSLVVIIFSLLACGRNAENEKLIPIHLPEETVIEDISVSFRHPCAYVNLKDIERIKAAVYVAKESDPVFASWLRLKESKFAQSSWEPRPVEVLVRGDSQGTGVTKENYIVASEDAAAAFQLALRWQISGEDAYADAAISILNDWASTCKKIAANDNNQYLLAGFQGHAFANAAELLRNYSAWRVSDQDMFKNWLKTVWYEKNRWFLENHGGQNNCSLHYWSNWELANMASMMAIGIYLEDKSMIAYVNHIFYKGEGSGALLNMIPFPPVKDPDGKSHLLAQNMESGRDQGHATLVVSMCAELCRMAQNVGLDFWGAKDNLVLAMCEYTAKYNVMVNGSYVCSEMPFNTYQYCMDCSCVDKNHGKIHTMVSETARGKTRPGWDLVYMHYVKEESVSKDHAYYSKLFAEQLRYTDGLLTGDGGAGDPRYGAGSGAYDQLGWGTLLFYQGP